MDDGQSKVMKIAGALKRALSAYLSAFRRRPPEMFALTAGIVCLPFINAHGVAAAMGLPFIGALVAGGWMLAMQVQAFVDWRLRRRARLTAGTILAAISIANMTFVAGGLAALNGDRLGQQLISRQTAPIFAQAQSGSAALDSTAAIATKLADYSSARAKTEGALDINAYAPTCPTSSGNKPGPISRWRDAAAEAAKQDAAAFTDAATRARAAATALEKARRDYRASTHDASMAAIAQQVIAINGALAGLNNQAMKDRLETLVSETGSGDFCPDPVLHEMVRNLITATSAETTAIAFEPLPPPDETLAVHDLFAQLLKIPTGDADLAPYALYLVLSPFIDLLLMGMLGSLLGRMSRNLHAESLRRQGLPEDISEARLRSARQAAAQDPRWVALGSTTKERRRRWTKETVAVNDDDAVALAEAEDLVSLKQWRLVGRDDDGRFIFALRPTYRRVVWSKLVREHLDRTPSPDEPVVLTVVEGLA